jgi:hypothetical protein
MCNSVIIVNKTNGRIRTPVKCLRDLHITVHSRHCNSVQKHSKRRESNRETNALKIEDP